MTADAGSSRKAEASVGNPTDEPDCCREHMILKKRRCCSCISALAIAIVLLTITASGNYYELAYNPTNLWNTYYSLDSEVDPNDEVAVFVNADDPNLKICIGRHTTQSQSIYGYLYAYGDDTTTPIKDGAHCDDVIEFRIWDRSELKEYYGVPEINEITYDCSDLYMITEVDLSLGSRVPFGWAKLETFAASWLNADCNETNEYCNWWDLNLDGQVDFFDYAEFAANWKP